MTIICIAGMWTFYDVVLGFDRFKKTHSNKLFINQLINVLFN